MVNSDIKIVFLGTPVFAATALEKLCSEKFNIVAVITQPDRKSGRGNHLTVSPVKNFAQNNKLAVFQPENKQELTAIIKKLKPNLCIVAAYGIIIEKEALEIPKFGFLNIHGSILPEYRGPSPVAAAILDGKAETGVTIMKISEKMDTGDILTVKKTPIYADDNAETLMLRLAEIGSKLLVDTIPGYLSGEIKPNPQDETKASYCKLVHKEDGEIKADDSAEIILRKIRAYTPWPGVYTYHESKGTKIQKAEISEMSGGKKGLYTEDNQLYLGTSSGTLKVLGLQPEGKKLMTAREYINGLTR